MNLRRIKHTLLRLTAEEKVIGIASIVMIIGCFFPWYSRMERISDESFIQNGLSGDLGVIGFVVFLMSIMSLLILLGENLHLPLPKFGYKREQILFFFLGEAFFLSLLIMAVYTKRSLDFTEAGLSFGIYTVLIAAFFGALSAFALLQKTKKKEVQELFSHDQESFEEEKEIDPRGAPEEGHFEANPEPMHFAEDTEVLHEIEKRVEDGVDNQILEDEMIEDIQEIPKSQEGQGNYFTREAGVDESAYSDREEKKHKSEDGMSMNFYEDK